MFLTLILMPTLKVMFDTVDSLGQLWDVMKNPGYIVPDKVTGLIEEDEDETYTL
jgi:hypothetical protein